MIELSVFVDNRQLLLLTYVNVVVAIGVCLCGEGCDTICIISLGAPAGFYRALEYIFLSEVYQPAIQHDREREREMKGNHVCTHTHAEKFSQGSAVSAWFGVECSCKGVFIMYRIICFC